LFGPLGEKTLIPHWLALPLRRRWCRFALAVKFQTRKATHFISHKKPRRSRGIQRIKARARISSFSTKQAARIIGAVQAHIKPVPGFRALTRISYQLANSYRALHLSGLCYRDISDGNLMFDPVAGEILSAIMTTSG
jgi:hypothetical protein